MRKPVTALFVCACLLSFSSVFSQSSLKGTIRDTLNKQNLTKATITVLRAKDSILVTFTRTDAQGAFGMKNLAAGNYIMLVSYPSYADYVENFTLESGKDRDFGTLPVITRANLLQEVIVRQRISAIRVKGDTTEYRADSFHVGPNADAQELLRKLPGIQVNSKGEITAQGEKVQKVLVDGEEFFSDDPAVVTKNLRADAIDKVQTFDKKSDQAAFTGIDDGQKIKTINFQLKEDKKKGYFGKVEAGTDFDKYRYGKLLLNAFKGKRKISGYLTTDNTKFESLNWDESRNYGGDANTTTQINDDGGIMIFSQGDDFSWGRGFPTSYTGGLHFSNKWNQDKHNSNNTYQYNNLNVKGITTTDMRNLLPGSNSFNSKTVQDQVSDKKRHKLTSIYEWQIDSSSSLKLTVRASDVKGYSVTKYQGQSIDQNGNIVNQSDRTTNGDDDNTTFNNNIYWRKKFKKSGRTISLNSDLNFNNRTQNSFLLARNSFFDKTGALISSQAVDQLKVNKQDASTVNSLVTYTEPLWKNTFLVLNYRLNLNRNDAERNTFNKDGTGKYTTLVDSLSNHFIFNTTSHLGSVNFRYNVKKVNFSVGSGIGSSTYHMKDVRKNADREVVFNNFIPALSFNYTPKMQRRVTFNYSGTTQNPTLAQIQPLIDNTDPLNITIGNAGLKQAFQHNFSFRASDFKVLKSRSMSINMNYSKTDNAISNASTVDSLNRRVNQSVNIDGNYSWNVSAGYGFEIIPSLNLNFNVGPSKNRYVSYVNNIKNTTTNNNINLGLFAGYWADKFVNFWMNFNANYVNSISSIQSNIATRYWSYSTYANVQLRFKKAKFFVDLNAEGNFYQKTQAFAGQPNVLAINPTLRKVFTKSDAWEVKLYINDLLNQNQGVSRSVNSNFQTATTYQTIQRYFMLSLAYNFNKNGKPQNAGF
ncbi:outer membrane beta-barrel protein [Sediminibacterium soli]|uniref:outer membrane beta-barrel protein n=1 Tax=Sediminibacterium soli TaxID=2698829 RepID=UPI001379F031|nr:outer membrane beta-barrel protein [Sediminibacterium soli]NCI47063.1 outer membrane beta-barrel protein [Sediminibacterium soli]